MSKSAEVFLNAFTLGMACGIRKCLEILSKYETRKNVSSSNITGDNENLGTDTSKDVSAFLIATANILNQFGEHLEVGADINLSRLDINNLCDKCNLLTGAENKLCDVFGELVVLLSRMKANSKIGDTPDVLTGKTEPQVDENYSKRNLMVTGLALELCGILEELAESITRAVSYFKPNQSTCSQTMVSLIDSNLSNKNTDLLEIKEDMTNSDLVTEDSQTKVEAEAKEDANVFSFHVYNTDNNKENNENVSETREIDSYHSCFDTGYGGGSMNDEEAYVSEQPSEEGLVHEQILAEVTGSLSGLHGDSSAEVGGPRLLTDITVEVAIDTDSCQETHGYISATDINGEVAVTTDLSPEAHGHISATEITCAEAINADDVEHSVSESQETDEEARGAIITEADAVAEESAWKDEVLLSDIDYDSLTVTEDEEEPEVSIPGETNQCQELVELSAVRMFKKHMETDSVDVDVFPTPHEEPKKQSYYTCRVLDFEATGCGRSKKVAKRDAVSKMIRLILKRQEEGRLPKEISPFSSEELSAMEDVQLGGEDYLSQLRSLCESENAAPPVFQVKLTKGPVGDKTFSVQCIALGRTAVGTCTRKRSAKRRAAREIIKQHEQENSLAYFLDAAHN